MTVWDDDGLMRDLDEAMHGAVSQRAREAARAAFAWRTVDEELMRLSHDSFLADEVLVRGTADSARVLGFEGAEFSLEVELDAGNVMGQVVPARSCRVAVLTPSGELGSAVTDDTGFFTLTATVEGPIRFTVTCDEEVQSTDWLTL